MRWILILTFLICSQAQARVFDLYSQTFATYFKGTYGLSQAGQGAFGDSSGSATYFSSKESSNYGGEVGFLFPGKTGAFRIGFQMIAPQAMHGISGNDTAGNSLMNLNSTVYGFFPMAFYEVFLHKTPTSRVVISLGGGYGKVLIKNNYTLTTAGNTQYNNAGTYNEQESQLTYIAEGSLGFETIFLENTTFSIDVGYHYAVANNLTYDNDVTSVTGTHSAGGTVLNSDGSNKKVNLSGGFVGVAFTFYFNY